MDPAGLPKECNGLGAMFVSLINEMKNSTPIWEDFISKSNKLNSALKVVSQALSAFFDAFQKVADLATNAQGATKEVGATLTRLCIRQKAMEEKSRVLSKLLVESLSGPLSEKLEGEWKKTYLQLDKDRMKDLKKVKAELKKASNDTLRLKKKASKKGAMMSSKNNIEQQLKVAMEDLQDRYTAVEDVERRHVRRALIEERARFCHFICCMKPVLDCQLGMLNDMGQISELLDSLCMQASDPESLPPESEALLMNLPAGVTSACSAPESSSLGSRKSSMASISSLTSNSSAGSGPSPAHQLPTKPSISQPGAMRLSSISSQDSGFTSQDTLYLQGMQALKSRDYQFMRTASGPSLSSSGGASKLPGAEGIVDTPAKDEDTAEGSGPDSDTEGEDGEEEEEEEEDAKTPCTPPPEESYAAQDRPVERPHTISGAFTSQSSRPPLSSMTFEPPAELYPNQALPPPVYANLANLAQAASRKCSIPAGMERTPPPPTAPSAAVQQPKEDAGRIEFQAELDRAVIELDRLTADMLADVDELWRSGTPNDVANGSAENAASGSFPLPPSPILRRHVADSPRSSGSASPPPLPPPPPPPGFGSASQYPPMRAVSMSGPPSAGLYGIMRRRAFPDPASKPPPPMRRNSAMASGPSSPEAPSPLPGAPAPLRSLSGPSSGPPPTSPKPKGVLPHLRPANPGPAGDAALMPPPSAKFVPKPAVPVSPNLSGGRRHSSIQSAKPPGEVQNSPSCGPALVRKGSLQPSNNAAAAQQQSGNCMAELTSVLKQRLHTQQQQQTIQLTPEQQLQQQQFLQKQQLLQQQQQQYMQQLQQQQQHHQQQQQQQQIYAQQQFLSHHQTHRQQQQHQHHQHQQKPQDSPPESTDSLSAALRAQGQRLRPTPFRNDRSAPNFG